MEVLKTIDEVFAYNLRRLRADRTQSSIAEAAKLSLRSYQALEAGAIPKRRLTRSRLAAALGAETETVLFQDPELSTSAPTAIPQAQIDEIKRAIAEREKPHTTLVSVTPADVPPGLTPAEWDLVMDFRAIDELERPFHAGNLKARAARKAGDQRDARNQPKKPR